MPNDVPDVQKYNDVYLHCISTICI